MKAKSRRVIETGKRTLAFNQAHPGGTAGDAIAVTRLGDLLASAEKLAVEQRNGTQEVRGATATKFRLRNTIRKVHVDHLIRIARSAAEEVPELVQTFARPKNLPYAEFRIAAGSLADLAMANRDLLVKYGLAEPVLTDLQHALAKFDEAETRGGEGRRAHIGASAALDAISKQIMQVVRGMDGHNRFRFADNPDLLATWESESSLVATPRPAPEEAAARAGAAPPAASGSNPAA